MSSWRNKLLVALILHGCHTADNEVRADRLRESRHKSSRTVLLDLRKAYLQLKVNERLWSFQAVRFREVTRLGFELSVGPRIIDVVKNRLLSEDPEVRRGAASFVDDILFNENIVSHEKVAFYNVLVCRSMKLCRATALVGMEDIGGE